MNTKDTKDEQPAQPPASPEELAKLGWQSIECPFCGSSGAQAFPKPAQQQEIDELTAQRDKLADILTRTANALKGQPPELVSHSWHDLPEVAQQLKSAQQQEPVELDPKDVHVEVVTKQMGGFAPVMTNGIRLTHKPTGTVVEETAERSAHRNRDVAWKRLTQLVTSPKPAQPTQQQEPVATVTSETGADMNDRELLEKAAKAAAIEGYKFMIGAYAKSDAVGLHIRNYGTSNQRVWNPLTDDGDALRLAVELNIVIWECAQYDRAMAEVRYGAARGEYWEPVDDDKYAATRRAIVRAAAQIGKEIK